MVSMPSPTIDRPADSRFLEAFTFDFGINHVHSLWHVITHAQKNGATTEAAHFVCQIFKKYFQRVYTNMLVEHMCVSYSELRETLGPFDPCNCVCGLFWGGFLIYKLC